MVVVSAQSEKMLAACALAVSQLQAKAAVGEALQARAAEEARAKAAVDSQQDSMDQWSSMQVIGWKQ